MARKPRQTTLFPDDRPRSRRIRTGFDATVRELDRTDRIGAEHAALIAAGRMIADDIDESWSRRNTDDESRYTRNGLYRTYVENTWKLLGNSGPDVRADDFADMFTRLRDAEDPVPAE